MARLTVSPGPNLPLLLNIAMGGVPETDNPVNSKEQLP
jgi:hypothetical protein